MYTALKRRETSEKCSCSQTGEFSLLPYALLPDITQHSHEQCKTVNRWFLFYSHSMMRGLGTSDLKRQRVVSRLLTRRGNCLQMQSCFHTTQKGLQKTQPEKPLHQLSTQRNLESRLTGQMPGRESEFSPKLQRISRPLTQLSRHNPSPPFAGGTSRRNVQKDSRSFSIHNIATSLSPLYESILFCWVAQALEWEILPKRKTMSCNYAVALLGNVGCRNILSSPFILDSISQSLHSTRITRRQK